MSGLDARFMKWRKTATCSWAWTLGTCASPTSSAFRLSVYSAPTAPETILNRDSGIVPLLLTAMGGYFCDIRDCADPVCLHRLLGSSMLPPAPVDFTRAPALEVEVCRAKF